MLSGLVDNAGQIVNSVVNKAATTINNSFIRRGKIESNSSVFSAEFFQKLGLEALDQAPKKLEELKSVVADQAEMASSRLHEVAEKISDNAISIVKKNPEVAGALVQPAVGMGVRVATLPVNSVLANHIFKDMSVIDAYKKVAMKPFKGTSELIVSGGVEFAIVFGSKPIFSELLVKQGMGKSAADQVANFPAAILASVVTAPLNTRRVQKQLGTELSTSIRGLYSGIIPVLVNKTSTWGVGLAVGDLINQNSPLNGSNSTVGEIANKTVGWVIGNFVGSPAYNAQMLMRANPNELKTMRDVCKHLKIDFNSKEGIKNIGKFWKGFAKGVPLMALSGIAIGVASKAGQEVVEKIKTS